MKTEFRSNYTVAQKSSTRFLPELKRQPRECGQHAPKSAGLRHTIEESTIGSRLHQELVDSCRCQTGNRRTPQCDSAASDQFNQATLFLPHRQAHDLTQQPRGRRQAHPSDQPFHGNGLISAPSALGSVIRTPFEKLGRHLSGRRCHHNITRPRLLCTARADPRALGVHSNETSVQHSILETHDSSSMESACGGLLVVGCWLLVVQRKKNG
jgi:hypothetical protein